MAKLQINKHLGKVINGMTIGEETYRQNHRVKVNVICKCGKQFNRDLLEITSGRLALCSKYSCPASTFKRVEDSLVYKVWDGLKTRCNNTKHNQYKNYGGRGIAVCKEWLESFKVFEAWSLVNGYAPGLQLDRVNNNGHYEPSNCRFVTPKENASNKRNNIYVWLDGLVLTAAEASRQLGHNKNYVSQLIRTNRNPYFPRLILNTPK